MSTTTYNAETCSIHALLGEWGAALVREESRARTLYNTDHGQWVIAAMKVKDLRAVIASLRR